MKSSKTLTMILAIALTQTAVAATTKKITRITIDNEITTLAGSEIKVSQKKVAKKKAQIAAQKVAEQKAAQQRLAEQQAILDRKKLLAANTAAASTSSSAASLIRDEEAPTSSIKIEEVKPQPAKETKFSSTVGMTVGKDSNLTPDKDGIQGNFYQISPSLSFNGDTFVGTFGANIKDWTDQQTSDIAKETVINAGIGANYGSEITKATSRLDFVNSDVMWPDYLSGTDHTDKDRGMPIRYFESKFTQTLGWDFGMVNVAANGSIAHRDYTSPYSDFAPDIVQSQTFEQDRNIAEGSGRVGVKFNDKVELAARPLVRHTKYTDEPARQTDGSKGGALLNDETPRREVLTTEINLDLNLTFGRINLVPTAVAGTDSDQALGALDTSYSGGGLSAELILDKDSQLKIAPSIAYKEIKYDNWTMGVRNGDFRVDREINTGVNVSVNVSKNVGLGLSYSLIDETSSWVTQDENYREEIIGSSVNLTF